MTLRSGRFRLVFVSILLLTLLVSGCSRGGDEAPADVALLSDESSDVPGFTRSQYLVGQPQNRAGIGDVDRAFQRYESTRGELIALFQAQGWFKDGLTRPESLFIERSLAFVSRYGRPRTQLIGDATVTGALFLYDKVNVRDGEVEVLLIYEPGQNAERQMSLIKAIIPALEPVVGVRFPERMLTVINGDFQINDFNEGQFIRIDHCCVLSSFVIAHELSHSYWSMGPSWFNEGLADLYAVFVLNSLVDEAPAGWTLRTQDIDAYYGSRWLALQRGRAPDLILPRRLAADGLYEAADVMFLDIRRVIGEQSFAAAVRDIYIESDFGRYNLRDKRIADIFLAHAGEKHREEVMAIFNKSIWGDNGERYERLLENDPA